MPSDALTPERILEATEDVLRRYGPAKATVVDVARVLGVSHGSVYRHFPSKAALREAVTARWLERSHAELAGVTAGGGAAPDRLADWLRTLFCAKRRKALSDPELFATYQALFSDSSSVVESHLRDLTGQLTVIVEEGAACGEFAPDGPAGAPAAAARAVFDATVRFHDPVYADHWGDEGAETELESLIALLLRGLGPR